MSLILIARGYIYFVDASIPTFLGFQVQFVSPATVDKSSKGAGRNDNEAGQLSNKVDFQLRNAYRDAPWGW